MIANDVRNELKKLATPEKAEASRRFFRSGEGEYGYGDQFIGVTVPEQRKIARQFKDLPLAEGIKLLQSPIHEDRLTALFILVGQFKKGDENLRKQIYDLYLANTKWVNNWDLVDSSAHLIVGPFIEDGDRSILDKLVRSTNLWERRIAMIAAGYFAKSEPVVVFGIAEKLIEDKHDLIQKAVGWMLREVGKKCGHDVLEGFLKKHYKQMGRTALRYSIEYFDEPKRQAYLKGTV